jgi:membrane fusion protein, multidrug efflux system
VRQIKKGCRLKKVHTWVALLGIAVLAGAAWWWQNRPAAPGAADTAPVPAAAGPGAGATRAGGAGPGAAGGPVTVEVGKVELMTLEDDAEAVGTLRSRQGVMLRPEVSGRIASHRLPPKDNAVRRGQLLVQLDDTLQRAQLQQAEAQASASPARSCSATANWWRENFVSQSAVDQSAAALEVAAAQVALAQAQLARMRIVLAPFDGQAGIRNVNLGDYVKDGADLVNMEDTVAGLGRLPAARALSGRA